MRIPFLEREPPSLDLQRAEIYSTTHIFANNNLGGTGMMDEIASTLSSLGTPFPSTVLIDTTNVCNARCPFCPLFFGDSQFDRKIRPATVMSSDLYNKLISEISKWEARPATLIHSANGEFLQDPHVLDRLATLRDNGLGPITVILTNGQYWSTKTSQAILDAEIGEVILGFDGATKEVYERHRVRCNYERVLENTRNFVHMRAVRGGRTRVTVKFVRTLQNAHEVVAAYELFKAFMDPEHDRFQDALAVDWADNATDQSDLYFVNKVVKGKRRPSCSYFDTGMMIHPDGVMGACCWDYNLSISGGGFGSADKTTALDIWRSEKRRKLGVALLAGNEAGLPKKCQTCMVLHDPILLPEATQLIPAENLFEISDTSYVYRF